LKIVLNSWFQLPYVGKDVFSDLMRSKVKRDSRLGFCFTSETNVARALAVLSKALNEPVELAQSCFVCDKPLEETSEGGRATICIECAANSDSYDIYVMKFAKLMETV
jgi:hypothetical protein